MRRRVIAAIALSLAVCLVGARIVWVNAHGATIPTEHYGMGEWVDLSGGYFDDLHGENMQGYSVRITKAESLSYNEFVAQYAKEIPDSLDVSAGLDEGKVTTVSDNPDEKTIVSLTYEIKNEGNDAGGIALFRHNLVPSRKNVAYTFNRDLWTSVEPQMKDQIGGFGLKKDSSYTTHVPFTFVSDPPYFQKFDYEILQPVAGDTSFELTLCNAPVRKIIDVEAS